jgi:peptide/nickel transport system substrate-binding protein
MRVNLAMGKAVTVMALVAVVVAVILSGCGGSDSSGSSTAGSSGPIKKGGTLHFAQVGETSILNPFGPTGSEVQTITVDSQITEPLFKLNNQNEKLEPWLVSKYEKSADDREWTFHLRPGVEFSNGKPMTAEDVVFTIEQGKKSVAFAATTEPITKAIATSPSTVVLKCEKPLPAMPALLSLYALGIVPKNYEGKAEEEFFKDPVGTGPFMLGSWKHGQSLTLVPNPQYWGKPPYLESVVFDTVPNTNSRTAQLKGGELDVIAEPPWSQLPAIENTPGLGVYSYEDGLVDFIILNSKKGVFKDPKGREAVSLALNRDDIVQGALSGFGQTAYSLMPLALPYADKSLKPPARDVAKAKELLDEAVKATGESPSFTLVALSGDSYATAASQIIQQDLEEAGFKVTIQPQEEATLSELLVSGETDATLLYTVATVPDPIEIFSGYASTEGFFAGADTAEVEKLNKEAATETDPEKRRELYYEIQELVAKENSVVVSDNKPWAFALSDEVGGFAVGLTGIPWLAEVGFAE